MPRTVDHALRRAELVEASWRVIRARGIHGTTTRAIAAEADTSLSVLAHFFGAKEDVLVASQTLIYERIIDRAYRFAGPLQGIDGLRAALEAALPFDEDRAFDAEVNVAFAAAALSDPALAEARRRSHARIRELLADTIGEARATGDLRNGLTDLDIGDEFIATVEGGALLALVDIDEDEQIATRLERLVESFIARVRQG
jgi:AcrR family transcriptional regulator